MMVDREVIYLQALNTADTTPPLTGLIDDNGAAITVAVNGAEYGAVNNGDGTWTLPDDTINELSVGIYYVEARAELSNGYFIYDNTTNELVITYSGESPPYAVSIDNYKDARPISGINEADTVYEFPVEGSITRLLAVYNPDNSSPTTTEIGPVRSARPYFARVASDHKAIYAHAGGSPTALQSLANHEYNLYNLDALSVGGEDYFWRDETRQAPHNLYTSIAELNNFRDEYTLGGGTFTNPWIFSDSPSSLDGIGFAQEVIIVNYVNENYNVKWTYNDNDDFYYRQTYENGSYEDYVDKNSNQIVATNLAIQYATTNSLTELAENEGDALLCREGSCIDGAWRKNNIDDNVKFYINNGSEEFEFKIGKLWIHTTDETVSLPDTVAPTLIEITTVPTPTKDTTPNYTFNTNEAGTITYGGSCSSVATQADLGNNTITFNELAEGVYNDCTITVTDAAGNASNTLAVAEFEIDLSASMVILSNLPTDPTNSTSANIEVSDDDIIFYKYKLDDGEYGEEISIETNIILSELSAGEHTIKVIGRDALENWSEPTAYSWTIDLTAPDPPAVTDPTKAIILNADTYAITGTAEAGSLVQIYNSEAAVVGSQQLTAGEISYSITVDLVQDSANIFTATATDLAGNESAPQAVATITEDSIAPTPSIIYSITALTNQDVVAVLIPNEELIITNNSGSTAYTFTANGQFTFEFVDLAGNSGSATAVVNNIDKEAPVITLIGESVVTIEVGSEYVDAGASALDDVDGDITDSIIIVNNVDENTIGSYTATYNVSDSSDNSAVEVSRTVNVADTTVPVITLNGDNPLNIEVGSEFIDPGATAEDNYDGDISNNIVAVSSVDINTVGAYSITYNVVDSSNNPAIEAVRTVNITPDVTSPVITLTDGDMNIYQGTVYVEPGAVVTDNVDTEIQINIGGDTVDTEIVGAYVVTYNASDTSGNEAIEASRIVTVLAIEESQTVLTDEVNLDTTAQEVLIGSNAPENSTITVPSSVTNAQLNVSALLSGTDTKSADLQTNITIESATSVGDVNVAIPAGQISADSSWTGSINVPQIKENSSVTVTPDSGNTASVSSVIEIGFDDVKLSFDKAVRIQLSGQAGRYIGYSRNGEFTQITDTCTEDTQVVGDALATDGDCKIDVNSDLIIWTKHFTKFVTYTQTAQSSGGGGGGGGGGGYDRTPPAQPKNFQVKRNNQQITISWTNPTNYDFKEVVLIKSEVEIDDSLTLAQLKDKGQEIYKGKDKQYIDTDIEDDKGYYYALIASDKNSNHTKPLIIEVKSEIKFEQSLDEEVKVLGVEISEREIQLMDIAQDAKDVYGGDVALTLANTGSSERDTEAEIAGYNDHTIKLISGTTGLSSKNVYAITNFVVYGTKTTQILGYRERAGVVNSYKSSFGKLPITQAEWEDVIKIANGRWPSETSEEAETKAKEEFQKIYKREANMDNPNDNAAVTVIAYGLRPSDRNLDSEQAAINIFRPIYNYSPTSALDWDIVRAIAYSGAAR